MFGRYMNNTLGYIHFYITLVGSYMIFFPMHFMMGLPRRYYSYSTFDTFGQFHTVNSIMTLTSMIVFAEQILFVIKFFYSIYKGRKVKEQNPWEANTLE